jgi:cytidine deaminase
MQRLRKLPRRGRWGLGWCSVGVSRWFFSTKSAGKAKQSKNDPQNIFKHVKWLTQSAGKEEEICYSWVMKSEEVSKAYQAALKARSNAYAPYSKFLVGACLKLQGSDEYISGCNVENASFGATVCAERVAIWNWASQKDRKTSRIEFMVLVTDTTSPVATPCGMCLQTMSEFLTPDTPIFLANLAGLQKEVVFKDLLPYSFHLATL